MTTTRLEPLDSEILEAHLEEILAIDADTRGERWTAEHWRRDLPGKWECSRLAVAGERGVVGVLVGSLREGALHVHRVAVRPESRGAGLGTALLAEAGNDAHLRSLDSVTLKVAADNDGAIRLYERLGFRRESGGPAGSLFMRASAQDLALAGTRDRSDERRCC